MLTKQEEAFIRYWDENRSRRKKTFRQFLVGIPVGLAFAIPIVVNLASGWDVQAGDVSSQKSLLMVLLVALLLIIGFVAIFYQKYKWDQYEQRYRELIARQSKTPDTTAGEPIALEATAEEPIAPEATAKEPVSRDPGVQNPAAQP